MTIREMIQHFRETYGSGSVWSGRRSTTLVLENKWEVSLSHNSLSCCGCRFEEDPLASTTVEVAIFRPDRSWYNPESVEYVTKNGTSVLCWQTSEEVFRIIEYVANMETVELAEGRIR